MGNGVGVMVGVSDGGAVPVGDEVGVWVKVAVGGTGVVVGKTTTVWLDG